MPEWGVKDGDWGSPDYIVQMRTAFENAASSKYVELFGNPYTS